MESREVVRTEELAKRVLRPSTLAAIAAVAMACPVVGQAEVVISEFMARNDETLADGNGEFSDWIELLNTGSNTVDLTGWYLSDDTNDLTKWVFPATNIAAEGHLIVFASGQAAAGYSDGLGHFHTTFKLDGDGESVVLTRADGVTVEDAVSGYPVQSDDVSYGIPRDSTYVTLIAADEDAKALIPTSGAASTNWHAASYDDTGWLSGQQGVGYDTGPDYGSLIGIDVGAMRNQNGSVYVRIGFDLSDADTLAGLSLRAKYDDGFVAYLNGVEIARANAPAVPAWNSRATASHEADVDNYEDFNVSDYADALRDGENMLAIHGLNTPTRSSDLLLVSELHAAQAGDLQTNTVGYLSAPTPGSPNIDGFLGYVADTKFTVDRGFFTNAFETAISCATEGASIYYTLDGTTPGTDNGTLYTDPITISRTSVLRAGAFKSGYRSSDVDTQTYIFIADVVTQSSNPSSEIPEWPTSPVNGQVFDYGMDPDVVNDARYADLIDDALLDIPSISIVTDPDNLFDTSRGIYVNAQNDGRLWERETSVELLNPNGSDGFQINAGIRIRGGMSRQAGNPKHSFRLFFRSEYGTARLNYKLFGDEGADSFKRMDLRTGQNFSWHLGNGGAQSTWLYDIFVRDAHREMGQPYTRGNFCHLYLNGQYWGLFQTEERPDARFGESYYGDDSDDYDTVKSGDSGGLMEATDGLLDAFQQLWTEVNSGVTAAADYFAIQGMNADGTENDSNTRLLDADNVIDYMLLVFYTGNRDSPLGPPSSGRMPRNLFSLYSRATPDGFKFIAHDAEHALGYHLTQGVNYNFLAERSASVASSSTLGQRAYFNPWWLHLELMDNAEYKLRFADRVHRHLFNDGVLTAENAAALLTARKTEMEMAIIAESARWGDYKTSTPRTKHDDWLPAVDNGILAGYLQASPNTRRDAVLSHIRAQGWYPTVDAPEFNQRGGGIASGFSLSISGSSQIYYTTDGSDPREIGGAVAGTAYGSALTLTQSTYVKARVRSGSTWSALTEATFVLDAESPLRVTEIMYNAAVPDGVGTNYTGGDFEFIEIRNTGTETVGLAGVELTEGVYFDFRDGDIATLGAGEYVVLVSDYDAFATRYTGGETARVAGEYRGRFFDPHGALANGGEDITLTDGLGRTIQRFSYDDWYDITDGDGFSLTLIDPTADTNTWNESSAWRPSAYSGGTPGSGPVEFPAPGDLVINEALTHQDQDDPGDWVELHNTSTNAIGINGWYLSDDEDHLAKVPLSGLSSIPAGGYLVLTEHDHFGSSVAGTNGFALSELGDAIYLSSGDGGELTGYRSEMPFGAADRDVTFGRHVKSDGNADFTAQSATTSGSTNAYPRVGPAVITELLYHPESNAYEFIELCNTASTNVPLYDTTRPTNTWKLDGAVEFTFPGGLSLAPGACIVITETNAAAFKSVYTVPAGVTVLGPYDGKLDNAGEDLMLTRPGEPEEASGEIPYILHERVEYDNEAPWPAAADTGGVSLVRVDTALYANDPASWTSSSNITPGSAGGVAPDPDADGDGMPDDWETTHFGGTDEPNGGAQDDWDGDGASNLDESRSGTNPTNAASVFAIVSLEFLPDHVITWLSAAGKAYSLWTRTNLAVGEFTLTESSIPATPPVNTHTTGVEGAQYRFYRLTVDSE